MTIVFICGFYCISSRLGSAMSGETSQIAARSKTKCAEIGVPHCVIVLFVNRTVAAHIFRDSVGLALLTIIHIIQQYVSTLTYHAT